MIIIKFCILLAIFVIQSNESEQKNEEKKEMIIFNIFASKWFEKNKSKLISITNHELLLELKPTKVDVGVKFDKDEDQYSFR